MAHRIGKLIAWIFLWVMIAVVGCVLLSKSHERQIHELHVRNQEQLQADDRRKLRALGAAKVAEESALLKQIADVDRELLAKLGNDPAGAFKHPDYMIADALRHAAIAAAPTNAAVTIAVDRFTEFTVTISRDTALSTNEMVSIAQKLLPHAAQYLHAVRFAQTNNVLAELDRQDIEFVEDWARASAERIAMLLPREQEPPAGTIEADRFKRDRQLAEMAQSDPQLSDKLVRAQKSFFAMGRAADEALRKAIEGSNQALNLADDLKPNYVKRRDALLEAAGHAKIAREFWANPAIVWRRVLETNSVSEGAIAALEPMVNDLLKRNDAKAVAAMDALDAKLESGRFFLQRLEDEGRPGRDTLVVDAPKRIERALEQLRADVKALDEAIRAWNEAREK